MKSVMTPEHSQWVEFIERLDGPEGCNFKKDKKGPTWKCAGGKDKSLAVKILKTMPEINVEKSLKFFEENSGFCDCEILFNVEHVFDNKGVKR